MEFRGNFARDSEPRDWIKAAHYALGLTVLLLLVAVRVGFRLGGTIPPVTPALSAAMKRSATAGHLALYLFMLAMPLPGWLLMGAEGNIVSFYGLPLPTLIAPDKAFAGNLEAWHEIGATVGYWLVGLHAAAALHHHYMRRDDTQRRMLPG